MPKSKPSKPIEKAKVFQICARKVKTGFGFSHLAQVLVPIPLQSFRFKHGVESGFVVNTKGEGIKTFYSQDDAKHSLALQRKASVFKAAPKVLSPVFPVVVTAWKGEGRGIEMLKKWAYKTQVADMSAVTDEEELVRKLKKAGVSSSDLHEDNIGVIDGETVRIDFGECST